MAGANFKSKKLNQGVVIEAQVESDLIVIPPHEAKDIVSKSLSLYDKKKLWQFPFGVFISLASILITTKDYNKLFMLDAHDVKFCVILGVLYSAWKTLKCVYAAKDIEPLDADKVVKDLRASSAVKIKNIDVQGGQAA